MIGIVNLVYARYVGRRSICTSVCCPCPCSAEVLEGSISRLGAGPTSELTT